jgi:hypothetical protein
MFLKRQVNMSFRLQHSGELESRKVPGDAGFPTEFSTPLLRGGTAGFFNNHFENNREIEWIKTQI